MAEQPDKTHLTNQAQREAAKWEYKIIEIPFGVGPQNGADKLNNAASDGWEIFQVAGASNKDEPVWGVFLRRDTTKPGKVEFIPNPIRHG